MALETRFYWHVSVLVKKKKKDSFRARVIPILHLFLHTASAYSFFDQRCLMGICFMNFGWFLSVKYIGWIFNNVNFGIYWRKMGASLIFLLLKFSSWLGDERSIFSANNLFIITLVFWEEGVSLFVCWLVRRWLGGW